MSGFFERPNFLYLSLVLFPALVFSYRRIVLTERAFSLFSAAWFVSHKRRLFQRSLCYALSWVFLCVAVAGPRFGSTVVSVREDGHSVLFVMDISRSMTVVDGPSSRLALASRYALMLAERLENIPCGLVLVKGSAVLSVPLTLDRSTLNSALLSLSPALLSAPGSGLASGIQRALESFPSSSPASRTIILCTDGDETHLSLEHSARMARSSGVRLIIVGFGSTAGADIELYPAREKGELRRTMLREDLLRRSAAVSGEKGVYVHALENASATRILAEFDSRERGFQLVPSSRPVSRYSEAIVLCLFFFGAGLMGGRATWQEKGSH